MSISTYTLSMRARAASALAFAMLLATAPSAATADGARVYRLVRTFNWSNGFPSSYISSVEQDRLGFLWVSTLSFDAPVRLGATDYEVYEGTIGAWYSHTPRACSTSGQLTTQFAPPRGTAHGRGSYGRASGGVEIPPGGSACVPQEIALSCP